MSLKSNLVEALVSSPVRWVNFTHANRGMAPIGFYHMAVEVQNDRVMTKIDRKLQGRIGYYDPGSNTIIASAKDFGSTYWDEKALLIHESAHAILDGIYAGKNSKGRQAPMRVVDDEIIGYLAGAFYLVAANAHNGSKSASENAAIRIAKSKLYPRPKWDGCKTFTFTSNELQPLHNAIIADPLYKKDWNKVAVHNGF